MFIGRRTWKVSFVYKFQFDNEYVDIAGPFTTYKEAVDYQMLIYESNEMWLNKNMSVVVRQTTERVPSGNILE